MERIENKMVVSWCWPDDSQDVKEKLNDAGYEETGTGIFVPQENVYDYALERLSLDEDLRQEFVEWFYSDNWVYENGT